MSVFSFLHIESVVMGNLMRIKRRYENGKGTTEYHGRTDTTLDSLHMAHTTAWLVTARH